jgi:hypothetical protein
MISGSGAGHETISQLMTAITGMMASNHQLTFLGAARVAARGNAWGDRPVVSPEIGALNGGGPSVRYALVIANASYPAPWATLNDVSGMTEHDSAFNHELERDYGSGHVEIEHDDTAEQMRSQIRAAIATVAAELKPGETGELMVNYQGHGTHTGMVGVDRTELAFSEFQALSQEAQRQRVHIAIVSDGCYGGMGTLTSQQLNNEYLGQRVAAAHLPSEETAHLQSEIADIQRDLELATNIGRDLEDFDNASENLSRTQNEFARLRAFLQRMGGEISTGLPLLSGELNARIRQAYQRIIAEQPNTESAAALRQWARDLDAIVADINHETCDAQEAIAMVTDIDR